MKWPSVIIGTFFCVSSLAGPIEPKPILENGKITLAVPGPAGSIKLATLQVTVGPLPPSSRIVVRSESGEVLGAIAPFGIAAARAGGTYTLPLSAELLASGKVSIVFTFEQERGKSVRAPR